MNEHQPHARTDEIVERINDLSAEHVEDHGPTDTERIEQGIQWAIEHERIINHATARVIASQLHEGQASALYSFSSTGAIDKARLGPELAGTYVQADTPDEVKTWVEQFGRYLDQYDDREPVEGWNGRHTFDAVPSPDDQEHEQSHELIEVYVASLTDYNNSRLHGVWIDATQEPEEIQEAIEFMLRNSYFPDAEEWAIHDHSGFKGLHISEWTRTEDLSVIAQGIEQHGEAFARWLEYMDAGLSDVEEAARQFEDHYVGHYDSLKAYAEDILDQGGYNDLLEELKQQLPEHLRHHVEFDVDGYARDLEAIDNVVEGSDGVYVFSH